MKEIIFIFLISHVCSTVYYIKKHGSVTVSTKEGIVYLDADKFGKNNKIHIQFNAHISHVDDKIYFEFSDNIPTSTFKPSIPKKPDSSWGSGGDDEVDTYKTNYDIKKDVSAKYLVIKYTGYYNYEYGGYLKILNTSINWGKFWTIFIISIFALFFFAIIGVPYIRIIIKKCKKKKSCPESITVNELQKTNYNIESSPTEKDAFYEPNNRENADGIDDVNNNIPQQQNIYYEPPNIGNLDTVNYSINNIPQK